MLSDQYIVEVKLQRKEVPSFDEYPFCLDAVRELSSLRLHPAVTFVIGENGSGKSTLLEAIAVAWGFNPEGGSKNFNFSTYVSHSDLHSYLRLSRGVKKPKDGYFLRAESFFNVASEIERLGPEVLTYYGGKSLHAQSHGESFLALFMNRFYGKACTSLMSLRQPCLQLARWQWWLECTNWLSNSPSSLSQLIRPSSWHILTPGFTNSGREAQRPSPTKKRNIFKLPKTS